MTAHQSLARVAIVAALAPMLLVAGCSMDDDSEPAPSQAAQAPKLPAGPGRTGGNLEREGSPGAAVMSVWRYMQVGAVPAAVGAYDDRIRDTLGAADLAGALQLRQPVVSRLQPEIAYQEDTPRGLLVVVRAEDTAGVSRTFSYTLRRQPSGWRIVYDTLLEAAIPEYIVRFNQPKLAPADLAKARPGVLREAQLELQRFRTAALAPQPTAEPTDTIPAPTTETSPELP